MSQRDARRKAAQFVPIMQDSRPREPNPDFPDERREVNCAGCNHLGDFDDEAKRGWCMFLNALRSTWHPAYCNAFVPLKRERGMKVVWQGVVYE